MEQEKEIEIGGVRVHYRDVDSGSSTRGVVVLLHGWGCNVGTMRLFEGLCSEGYRVLNIDLPGFGGSSEPPRVYREEDYAQVIASLCAAEGVERPVIIGHSFGGRVGIVFASNRPVERLVLVDSAGVKPRRSLRYYATVWCYKVCRWIYPLLVGRERGERKIEEMRRRRGSADYTSSSAMMRRVMVRCVNRDLRPEMRRIDCPTLLLWGEADTATPLRDARIMVRNIKGAKLVSFAGAGHYSFVDNPYGCIGAIKRFLAQ